MNVETTWCTCLFNLFYLGNAENSSPCPPCAGAKVLLHLQTKECTNSCRPEVVDFPDAIPCCSWDISNVHITSSYITRVLSKTCHFYIYIYCTNCIYSLYILIVYSIIFYIYIYSIFFILLPVHGVKGYPSLQRLAFQVIQVFQELLEAILRYLRGSFTDVICIIVCKTSGKCPEDPWM
jgi:hypothetical protein